MKNQPKLLQQILSHETGQAMAEYAILIAILIGALVGVFRIFPGTLAKYYLYITSILTMPIP